MIRKQSGNKNIPVSVADFPDFKDDENHKNQEYKVGDDIIIHYLLILLNFQKKMKLLFKFFIS